MRNLHSFLYLGGLFVLLVCSFGVFIFPEEALDGLMYASISAFVPSLVVYPFFPVKKMVHEEIPDPEVLTIFNEDIDIGKWEKERIQNDKYRLLLPFVGWIGFLCITFAFQSEASTVVIARIILLLLASVTLWTIIDVIMHQPKPTTKQMIHHA